ncbi:cadherin-like domain-containing protein [Gymnodinialimonas hymeniacidonis]|uniref:cadherin-like domain-containing protein n=1 Tax=Gymnodinialimonas hymeniacidonis TaxID=3126508 RepID=UPI0034C5E660
MTTVIDFNNLSAGDVVTNQFQSNGVTITASGGSGDAMIFDTSNPTGGDHDLATNNLGNVLIISEDGDSSDPDDNAGGGTVVFAFETAATVKALTFLDIEETAEIKLLDADGNVIDTIHAGPTGNNGQCVVHIDVAGVASMEVTLHGSGAIDNLEFVASAGPDYIVEGTSGDDLIDAAYDQDPEGDMVDAGDNQLGNDDDSIRAGAGDDTVYAGEGDDTVEGGSGNDFILGDDTSGDQGDDLLLGEDGDDTLCGLGGDDTLDGGAGADVLEGMDGDDLILGGSGNDKGFGDAGNDTLYGDSGTQDDGSVREVFQWDLGPSNASDFSQNTGNVTVSFSEVNGGASDNITSDTQLVDGIDTGGAAADATSSLDSETSGQGNSDTYTLGFSDPVENVSFRVNDIDGDGVVTIKAFDENGDPIEVQLAGGDKLTLIDTDGDGLADTADSNGGYEPDTSENYSVLVTIPGPVSEIEIFHTQDGGANSGINVTDVYFDVPGVNPSEGAGDDTLVGGAGDDLIYGEGGDDSLKGGTGNDELTGGDGADTIKGGDDADTIFGGNNGDVVDGGTGSTAPGDANDMDVLDLTGEGPFRVIDETPDGDGNSTSGTIQFVNADGTPTGDTLTFTEIETILGERFNDDPDAMDDTVDLDEDTSATFNPLANDSDPNGDALTITDISDPANGTLTDNGDGTFTYTPDENFNGTDSVTYTIDDGNGGTDTATVTFNVAPVNDDPVAVDDSATTPEDTAVVIDLIGNDTDVDGDTLELDSVSVDPALGTVVDNGDGTVTFTPAENYNGPVVIDYTVSDGNGGTDDGQATVNVTPVNDAPDAVNDNATTPEDTPVTIDVLDNDTDVDGDTLTITGASVPADQGTVEIVGGELLFTPAENFNGPATISYSIEDGNGGTDTAEVVVDVTPVNDDPVAVDDTASTMEDESVIVDLLGNDTDVDGDTLELASVSVDPALGTVVDNGDGTVTFTPAPDYNGPVVIDYTVSDGNGGTDDGQAVVSVGAVNDGPVAEDDTATTDEDTPVTIDVLGNDSDPDGDALEIVGATVPADQGTVEVVNNELVFTPAENYNGPAEITYTVTDNNGGTDTATVDVTVTPVNDDPVAVDDIETTDEDVAVVVDLLGNDTDVDGDTLELASVSVDPAEGSVVDNGDGTVTFTPAPNFNGPATISYTVSDGNGGTDEGEAIVSVGAVNDGPVAEDDTATTDEDTPVTIDVLDNDSDADGDDLTIISAVVDPAEGTVDIVNDELVFTPADDFNGDATITYTIADGNGGTDTADVVVTVNPVDDAPVTVDDTATTDEDTPVIIDPLANDSDPDGQPLVFADTPTSPDGTVEINPDGTITFTPDENFNGETTIDYVAEDPDGNQTPGQITVTVNPVNDAPDAVDDGDVTDFETAVEINLFANDSDVDGDTLTVTEATVPADQGTLAPTGTEGVYTFTPADGFEGTATVSYTISDGNGGTDSAVHTIEVGADPTPADGVVDGEEFGELMGPGYNDDNLPTDGGGDQIDGDDGDDDVIEGNGGDDTINAGQGSDTVSGGTGDDSIDGGASPDGDDLSGDEGDDTINGGGGDDTIDGGVGDDVLDGGADDDDITGGDGNDSVIGGGGNDTIDTSSSENLLDSGWPGYGPIPAVDPDADPDNDKDTVFAGEGDDVVSTGDDADVIDAGTGDDTVDAGIDNDSVTGGQGEDLLIGGEGADTLLGGQDDDTIFGGLETPAPDGVNLADDGFGAPFGPDPLTDNNNDSIDGGAGNDLIFGQDDDDTITGGTGNDTIDGGVDNDSILGGQGDDVIEGGHGQDFIQGNNNNDSITGGRGSDTLEGNAGSDTINGGAGDSILGGADADSIVIDQDEVDENGDNDTDIVVDGGTSGIDTDTLDLSDFVSYRNLVETVDPDGDSTSGSVEVKNGEDEWVEVTFAEIEDLILPPKEADGIVDGEEFGELMGPGYDDANAPTDGGGDQIDGDDGIDDVIEGNGGDDTIDAGLGDDTVSGGTGDDVIDGGADDGDDSIDGDEGNDSILGGEGDDTIDGGDDDDTVRGNEGDDVVSGGDGDDSVTGGAGDDTLDGGDGDDSLTGGSGDDVIDGGEGDDTITGSTGNDSITDLEGDNEINSDNPGSFDPDRGVPIPTAGGTGPFIITPPDADPDDNKDTITTGDGDDTINSGDDADVIDAGDGDNVIDGGTDDDTITTGDGNDSIIGGEGSDNIDSGDGDDTIDGGVGSPAANFIDEPNDGFTGDPILDNGDDTINAGAGDDVVRGEDDNDLIDGGEGDDTLDGGIDDDTIFGGDGNDVIVGGQGADSLDGGFGDDVFNVGTFTDPNGTGDYQEGIGDEIVGGEDPGDGDEDTLDLTGSGSLKVVFDDSIDPGGQPGESGTVIFYTDDTQTEESGRLTFKEIENVIPCFTPGAMIATPRGEVPVESLREGDKVITRDNGIQEIRWTGKRTLNREELADHLNMKPIFIKAGSLGHNLPERDMLVSPQHRVLITGETPQLYFEESEVLVAAKHLVGRQGIGIMDTMRTTYIHFMFDRHEVVLSDGAWTESFQPGDQTLGSMGEASREEIFALFPELATEGGLTDYAAARRSLKAHEAKLLQL